MTNAFLAVPVVLAQEDMTIELNLTTILTWAVIGLVIGAVARVIVPRSGGMGVIATILIGIVGAVVGGWLAGAVFQDTQGVDWIASILVAALLIWMFHSMSRRRTFV